MKIKSKLSIAASVITAVVVTGFTALHLVNNSVEFSIILALVSILVAAAIFFFVFEYITKPITTVMDTLKNISQEGDLTLYIPEEGDDEISDMSRYFNRTLAKVKRLIISVKEYASVLHDTGNDLSGNMAETSSAMNQITANIQNIKNRMINQSASVTQTNSAMEQISNSIGKLNGFVEKQSYNVALSSSAIEDMLASIQSITRTLVKKGEIVNELNTTSEIGRKNLEEAFSNIQEIARDSEELLEINNTIKDIAHQVNMLSMNAAIAAARAENADDADAFMIVADGINTLAINCSKESKEISSVLRKIKGSIDKVNVITGAALSKVKAVDSNVKTVSELEEDIRNAINEQNQDNKEILEVACRLNDITRQVEDESIEMFEESRDVIQENSNLDKVTREISGGIDEMESGAEQINEVVSKIQEVTMKNRENFDYLVREVSLFKVA